MSEWVQLTPEQSLEVGREAAYYINCVSSKWAHAIKVGELGSRVSFSTAELAAIPLVAAQRAALEAVEWIGGQGSTGQFCPWCRGLYPEHVQDCQRQTALAALGADQ